MSNIVKFKKIDGSDIYLSLISAMGSIYIVVTDKNKNTLGAGYLLRIDRNADRFNRVCGADTKGICLDNLGRIVVSNV